MVQDGSGIAVIVLSNEIRTTFYIYMLSLVSMDGGKWDMETHKVIVIARVVQDLIVRTRIGPPDRLVRTQQRFPRILLLPTGRISLLLLLDVRQRSESATRKSYVDVLERLADVLDELLDERGVVGVVAVLLDQEGGDGR